MPKIHFFDVLTQLQTQIADMPAEELAEMMAEIGALANATEQATRRSVVEQLAALDARKEAALQERTDKRKSGKI